MVAITERFGMGSSTPEWMIKLNPFHRVRFPVARLRRGDQIKVQSAECFGTRRLNSVVGHTGLALIFG